jgi:phosphoserine aminotransferase
MINFYPGPSKIYPSIEKILVKCYKSGILEHNHRSEPFMNLLMQTIVIFKEKMNIPTNYEVFFTSSATECWEIVAQSFLHGNVQLAYNGAFGKKWFKYLVTNPSQNKAVKKLEKNNLRGSRFFINQTLTEVDIDQKYDCFCVVQNETSNGSYIANSEFDILPKHILSCLDITSSLGGQNIDFTKGDVFLASSQKCLGLPSGLGILIVSPKAISIAEKVNDRNHYNSFLFIRENFKKYQTPYTPNILAIYLLNGILQELDKIDKVSEKLEKRALDFYSFIEEKTNLKPLISNPLTRSPTVFCIEADKNIVSMIKSKAQENEILLGNGYGEWKENTLRVANFPAIPDEDFDKLKQFLLKILD